MLIIALDYEYAPASELTCTKDARTMYRMAGRAGVDDITIITDKEPKRGRAWRWYVFLSIGICQMDWFIKYHIVK